MTVCANDFYNPSYTPLMKNQALIWPILWVLLLVSPILRANNIQVDHVSLTSQNTVDQYTLIEFDLSWENSWRYSNGPSNWDAAWVFVKFRVGNGIWRHATLNYVNGTASSDGHTESPGATLTTPADGKGIFIYRASDGSGNVDWNDLQLRWNYGVDGVGNNAFVDVEVFAIEMVYVPQGNFMLGGGTGGEVGKLFQFSGPLNFTQPYPITSEGQISVGPGTGNLHYLSPASWDAGDQLGPIPAQFPKGYDAFYCMKYEVTQQQWISFFNMLTPAQKAANDITDLDHRGPNTVDRSNVDWEGVDGAYTTLPYIPMSFMLWGDILAYMDWAGLRPMSEFEFVKACRGPLLPVSGGYAWGTDQIIASNFTYDLMNKNSADELLVNPVSGIGNANWIYSAIFEEGPYRNGIFAASAVHPGRREDSGGSYYGIMELSGNLSEMAVTIGTPEGRAYQGNHGDGAISTAGEADVPFWPPATGAGGGLFGGSWFSLEEELRINDRRSATIGDIGYFNDVGFRCVRTAP